MQTAGTAESSPISRNVFLPFLLHARGGTGAVVGLGLALLFTGGALGKAACGWLGQHLGAVWSVIATEAATALLIIATLILPLAPMLAVLPLLGIVLNGTSSVLYGTVPDLAPKGRHRPWIRAVLHGCHRRGRVGADRLRRDCRSFQSDRRYSGRGVDRRRHHTSDSRALAHLGKRAQSIGRATIMSQAFPARTFRCSESGKIDIRSFVRLLFLTA